MLTTRLLDPRRLHIVLAVLVVIWATLFAQSANGASRAETRTFSAIDSDARDLSFRLAGVKPASIRRARLIAGHRVVSVPLTTVRRGARRGVLRLPRSFSAGDHRAPRAKLPTRGVKLVLTLVRIRRDRATTPVPVTVPDGKGIPVPTGGNGSHAPASQVEGATSEPQDGPRSALAGMKLHVEVDSFARRQADAWRASRPLDAAHMDRIAAEPQAGWLGEWSGDIRSAVAERVSAAARMGSVSTLVAYNIPQRDCGSHSAGGAASADAYRTWIREFAGGVGGRPAIVVLEPDALAGMDCLSSDDKATRLALLEDAVSVLAAHGSVATYIDAGHSAWQPAHVMANRLDSVGIARIHGFSLNVSNTRPTSGEVAYGQEIAGLTGGKRFVVDTSRNGPATASAEWCNPLGRALGRPPTTETGQPFVDAFLWIKRPGESDGTCNGGPPAGAWWPEYALGLAQRAS